MVSMRSSRALEAAGYDDESRTLRVRFREGHLYDYHDVPRHVYEELVTDPHPWTRWGQHIKDTYKVTRLD